MSSPTTAPRPLPVTPGGPRITARVSLADRAGRSFAPLACVRGYRYYLRKRVEVSAASERGLDATVKGKRVQTVRLRVEAGRLGTSCTCCARLLGPATCKHVWATLLEIDHRGLLEGLRSTARPMRLGVVDEGVPGAAKAAPRRTRPSPKDATPAEAVSEVAARARRSSTPAPAPASRRRGTRVPDATAGGIQPARR